MRQLTGDEIERLVSRLGARRMAVENFLMTMGQDEEMAGMNLERDSHKYGWNEETQLAIRDGIRLAERAPSREVRIEAAVNDIVAKLSELPITDRVTAVISQACTELATRVLEIAEEEHL